MKDKGKGENWEKTREERPVLMRKREMKMNEDEKGMKISMREKLKGKKTQQLLSCFEKK